MRRRLPGNRRSLSCKDPWLLRASATNRRTLALMFSRLAFAPDVFQVKGEFLLLFFGRSPAVVEQCQEAEDFEMVDRLHLRLLSQIGDVYGVFFQADCSLGQTLSPSA